MSKTSLLSLLLILASLIGIASIFSLSNLQIYDWVIISIIVIMAVLIICLLLVNLNKSKDERKFSLLDICEIISYMALLDFGLFILISLLIGGSAFNGKTEGVHYFIGGGGKYIEVNFIVYVYSICHTVSIFILFPLAIVASYVYWLGGGWSRPRRPRTFVNFLEEKPVSSFNILMNKMESIYWRIIDFMEGIIHILLDSWRKPDLEIFINGNREECIKRLCAGMQEGDGIDNPESTIIGYYTGHHFIIRRWRNVFNMFLRNAPILVVAGSVSSENTGTKIKAWHRFATGTLLFMTVYSGIALFLLSLFFGAGWLRQTLPQDLLNILLPVIFTIILPGVIIIFFLLLIIVGSILGEIRNTEIMQLIKEILQEKRVKTNYPIIGINIRE